MAGQVAPGSVALRRVGSSFRKPLGVAVRIRPGWSELGLVVGEHLVE